MFPSIFESGLLARQEMLGTGDGSGTGCCTAHELARLSAQVVLPDAQSPQRRAERKSGGLPESRAAAYLSGCSGFSGSIMSPFQSRCEKSCRFCIGWNAPAPGDIFPRGTCKWRAMVRKPCAMPAPASSSTRAPAWSARRIRGRSTARAQRSPRWRTVTPTRSNNWKVHANAGWAWPPRVFDNLPAKVKHFIDAMLETGMLPALKCFDVSIVRWVKMYRLTGMDHRLPKDKLVMGVALGVPAEADLLLVLLRLKLRGAFWQTAAIGRTEIGSAHRCTAERVNPLRSGLEDTFYLSGGSKVASNVPLIGQLVRYARQAGREVILPQEFQPILGLAVLPAD